MTYLLAAKNVLLLRPPIGLFAIILNFFQTFTRRIVITSDALIIGIVNKTYVCIKGLPEANVTLSWDQQSSGKCAAQTRDEYKNVKAIANPKHNFIFLTM